MDVNSAKIDVVMPTWNSNGWWFPKVLESIKRNCNLCHLIVVDKFSTDGTLEAARNTIPEGYQRFVQSNSNLARARQLGISLVDSKQFAFVDSDVELCENWQALMAEDFWQSNVGAVQGTEVDPYEVREQNPRVKDLIPVSKLSLRNVVREGLFNLVRGMTTQTMLSTDLVRDWLPIGSPTSFEDFSMTQHVLSKGKRWTRTGRVVSIHHKYPAKGKSKFTLYHQWYLWNGAGAKASGEIPLTLILVNSVARVVSATQRFLGRECSFEQLLLASLTQLSIVQGYLQSPKYLVRNR
jgi:glycosyltransferase involved in cell wall biosynthesis